MTQPALPTSYAHLRACFINTTLKAGPRLSHTAALMHRAGDLLERLGIQVDWIRAADHALPPGMAVDMTSEGFERDDWPQLLDRVLAADILVIGTPIWLSSPSSVCTRVIERLYAASAQHNERGQYTYYGRVGACIATGNEDGVKSVSREVLYALQHIGYTIPPQADAGWIGEIGPGKSYADDGSGGPDNDFTQRQITFMTWNLVHLAHMFHVMGGIPPIGNLPDAWAEGERWGFRPDPAVSTAG